MKTHTISKPHALNGANVVTRAYAYNVTSTTARMIDDIERVRMVLNVYRWLYI